MKVDLLQLKDKNIVIMGVANERSIAWGVAQSLYRAGANLIFTYRQERSQKKLNKLLEKHDFEAKLVVQCDVNNDESIAEAFKEIGDRVGVIHGLVHSVAFAHAEDLKGDFVDTSREGYAFANDTSAYSIIAVAREAKNYMTEGGSIIGMTYLGAQRVIPEYKVMGIAKAALETSIKYLAEDLGKENIRVNAISAGPIRTLAAKGIPSFNDILKDVEERAPLRKNVTKDEVGDMTMAMMSHLSRGVTGEIIYVDSGFNLL
ncbi:enoyl-ACP reductase FabI [Salinibacillus xinjiangensis]|uniref:Enoyl-[acyl-carrier-protein] reductase [NADH] n=1 Tax=Salinibacillus xinjiangensis TaxID=1229268 RepID=A0A6G1X2Z9_9BACI|nr:enoyl-ACP reductase FabI [Salinibacillus xinjiangensis]MRG85275.1 enoyl-ACP reductase FabI [Salinibacillus xinjiangensis]